MTTTTDTGMTLAEIFAVPHSEGRAVMRSDEFLLAACAHDLSARTIARAQRDGILRSGLCGFWLREAPDAGAILVMRAALSERAPSDDDELND